MQRILATSVVLLSLGAFADVDSPVGSRLAHSEEDRRRFGPRDCVDNYSNSMPHGSRVLGADGCQEHVCQDGRWIFYADRCQGDDSLGLPAPVPASNGNKAGVASGTNPHPNAPILDCPLPTLVTHGPKAGKWTCPDESLTLAERRTMFESMKPFDEINGVKLDDFWPATAGKTVPIAKNYQYSYEGINFKGYKLSRPTGERAPIHYHEVSQLLCLESGKILVLTDGEPEKMYQAPDCYMMPAYTKVSVISLETKVESCLLRVPKGGLDWVVIEPKYYDLQGQWTEDLTGDKKQ